MAKTKPAAKAPGKVRFAYSEDIAAAICGEVASGKPLNRVCARPDMPGESTVFHWLSKHPDFAARYATACEERATVLAEEALTIADAAEKAESAVEVHAARLRIDTRKWFAARLNPRKYGDQIGLSGSISVSFADVAAAAATLRRAGAGEAAE